MPTIIATPGGATSNSYVTILEADAYFESRLPLVPPWEDQNEPEAALIMATRLIDSMFRPMRVLVPKGEYPYYIVRRQWTGTPSTTTQRLAWPRTGMKDRNGNAVDPAVIPQDLKDALAELAGQLGIRDSTLENDISVQGITSVKAGSVSVTFKDMIESRILPEAVLNLMPYWWFTDEMIVYTQDAEFQVI